MWHEIFEFSNLSVKYYIVSINKMPEIRLLIKLVKKSKTESDCQLEMCQPCFFNLFYFLLWKLRCDIREKLKKNNFNQLVKVLNKILTWLFNRWDKPSIASSLFDSLKSSGVMTESQKWKIYVIGCERLRFEIPARILTCLAGSTPFVEVRAKRGKRRRVTSSW